MHTDYVKGFHQLPEELRINYHLLAIKQGFSLDDALLADSKKFNEAYNQAIRTTLTKSTNLHIFSPKKTMED